MALIMILVKIISVVNGFFRALIRSATAIYKICIHSFVIHHKLTFLPIPKTIKTPSSFHIYTILIKLPYEQLITIKARPHRRKLSEWLMHWSIIFVIGDSFCPLLFRLRLLLYLVYGVNLVTRLLTWLYLR